MNQQCGNCGRYMVEVDTDLFECQHCGDITDVRYLGMDHPFENDEPIIWDDVWDYELKFLTDDHHG
jgi:hypothetical protein